MTVHTACNLNQRRFELWVSTRDQETLQPVTFEHALDLLATGIYGLPAASTNIRHLFREIYPLLPEPVAGSNQVPRYFLSPAAAWQIIGKLATGAADFVDDATLWLWQLMRGIREFVAAGQLVFGGDVAAAVGNSKSKVSLYWQIAPTPQFLHWCKQLAAVIPESLQQLELHVGAVGNLIADSLVRSILVQPGEPEASVQFGNQRLVQLLAGTDQLTQNGMQVAVELKKWARSISVDVISPVVIVHPPRDEQPEDQPLRWPVELAYRIGGGQVTHIPTFLPDSTLKQQLEKARQQARQETGGLFAEPGCFFQTIDAIALSKQLIQRLPQLKKAEIQVFFPKGFVQASPTITVAAKPQADFGLHHSPFADYLQFNWQVALADQTLTPSQLREIVEQGSNVLQLGDKFIQLSPDDVSQLQQFMQALGAAISTDASDIKQLQQAAYAAFGEKEVQVSGAQLAQLANQVAEQEPHWQVPERAKMLLGGAGSLGHPQYVELSEVLRLPVKHHQQRGVDWLFWMSQLNLGVILADDMGLGKTMQALALVAAEKQQAQDAQSRPVARPDVWARANGEAQPMQPVLVVCPTSVLNNWMSEVKKFTTNLAILSHYGRDRAQSKTEFIQRLEEGQIDVVFTTYAIASRDIQILGAVSYDRIIVDEAQLIKRATTKVATDLRRLTARHRVALTGTPIENNLEDLRAILDFCNPGILGDAKTFRNRFLIPIEKYGDEKMAMLLRRYVAPFMLRRQKTDPGIVDQLPDKRHHTVVCHLSPEQLGLYQAVVDRVNRQLKEDTTTSRFGLIMTTLTALKQICNHPDLYTKNKESFVAAGAARSGKLVALQRLLDKLLRSGRQILLFTQYVEFADPLAEFLTAVYRQPVPVYKGANTVDQRRTVVKDFQAGKYQMLVVSLRAGGTGINLTAASIVIHLDQWWNPAVETQATDRAYRIGQQRNVDVYTFVTAGTLEEHIASIIEKKQQLQQAIIGKNENWIAELSVAELQTLIQLGQEFDYTKGPFHDQK